MSTTLVDRFGRQHTYLRISVTDRCNLRCLYCMPGEDIVWKRREELLTFEEIERVTKIAVDAGIRKVRLTGGEPFARAGIEKLIPRIKSLLGLETLAVTTNAVLLKEKLPAVHPFVDAFNVSLDTFKRDKFRELTGRDKLAEVMEGIEALLIRGYQNLKLNVVVMKGINDDELLDFARFAEERPIAVRFIEFMPFAGNQWSQGKLLPMADIVRELEKEYQLQAIPEERSPISRDFRLARKRDGFQSRGSIGIIASMSAPFCSSCSRLRMTAEGKIMPCLHSPLEFDLRKVLRSGGSDVDILNVFLQALGEKPEEHPPAEEMMAQAGRVMIQIGG
ncbi:MAG: GTP 3',8-cyclase MoaA [Ignavibacteriae bacterium]|nr:GTP 3',8-cyclase MoaA [Ignavibacteriota bacterium]MCB9214887.1 GTP 3',8-cyclase MoaA [Ignavibacteria bacterium]